MLEEIGFWSTEEGTIGATLEFESDVSGPDAQELPSWASGALKGAAAGAATGIAGGPYGALIGAGVGALVGAASSGASSSSPPTTPPKAAAPPATGAARGAPASAAPGVTAAARTNAVQALQQFAALVPALIQLVAASGQGARRTDSGEDLPSGELGEVAENLYGPGTAQESLEGFWTTP